MPSIDDDDVFSSRFLSPTTGAPRKSPSRQSLSLNGRKSTASLRGTPLADALGDDAANGRHSLAHELAAALLPEPSAGSKLLAEEFGIEYDEGAEGIDGVPHGSYDESSSQFQKEGLGGADSLAVQLNGVSVPAHTPSLQTEVEDVAPDFAPGFRSPAASPTKPQPQPEQDPMAILAGDLLYTEKFLAQLQHLDAGEPSHSTPTLERLASDVIRRINDATRDREGQVRELLECEREFRKIAGEVGGNDALGHLPELEDLITDDVPTSGPSSTRVGAEVTELETIAEDSTMNTHDWEVDPDRARLGDEDDEYDPTYPPTPVKTEFAPPPAVNGPPTFAAAIPFFTHLRTYTTSTATSLATISEHTQVNAAATTEAGRKIRALKNKLGGWRTEWDSAERSRLRIEKWEAGIIDGEPTAPGTTSPTPTRAQRRIDGRKVVQEHLKAFEKALIEANTKTQAIIAAVS